MNMPKHANGEAEIRSLIASVHEKYGYVADPHTACAFKNVEDLPGHRVILSTAPPAKFPETIQELVGEEPTHPSLEQAKTKTPNRYELPADASAIREFITASSAVN